MTNNVPSDEPLEALVRRFESGELVKDQWHFRGGSNEAQNLRWLCGFHNRHRFETSHGVLNEKPEMER